MVVRNDTIECVVSQLYQIFLQNTLTHVLAVGFTVTGLKDRCVVRVQSLHRKGRKSFIPKGVISLDPTGKVIWNYLVPFYLVPPHLWSSRMVRRRGSGLAYSLFQNVLHLLKTFSLSNYLKLNLKGVISGSGGGRLRIVLILSTTCSAWESWTKSLCTIWLVSTWERRLITWLRSSRHCWCRAAWHSQRPVQLFTLAPLGSHSLNKKNRERGFTLSLVRALLVFCTWDSATRRPSSSVRLPSSSACNWSFSTWILSVSVFKLENCTAQSNKWHCVSLYLTSAPWMIWLHFKGKLKQILTATIYCCLHWSNTSTV